MTTPIMGGHLFIASQLSYLYEQTKRSLYNPLNVELCSTTAKQLALFTLQLYHYSLNLALYQSTSPHPTLHAEIYQPTFKTLKGGFQQFFFVSNDTMKGPESRGEIFLTMKISVAVKIHSLCTSDQRENFKWACGARFT